ncbi:BPSL0761 family protein [Caballeronia calidae]|uniref:BPSL0761 family protein n=1 Tax=Caballeronia calidae TaxID=1777139 RepID=UPI0009413515
MTTPEERTRAILGGRELLATLAQGRGSYSPDLVRTLAMTLLRHYPLDVDIDVMAAALPHLWAESAKARRRPIH